MQKTKKKRKGFTLTELAIVIAVIAILIAVLVPTFVSLINKANESADEQAVKSMNTSLAADEAINGKPDSAVEAVAVLEADGFNVKNYVALESGNTIYYDLTYNRCLIWTTDDEGTGSVTYPSDLAEIYASAKGIAANWYTFETIYMIKDQTIPVSTEAELTTALSSAKTAAEGETVIIELSENMGTVSYSSALSLSKGAYITVDLNGNTLAMSTSSQSLISNGSTLYFKDGTINSGNMLNNSTANNAYKAESNSSITLENITLTSSYLDSGSGGALLYAQGDAAQINVFNSTIDTTSTKSVWCIGTNAGSENNYNVSISVEDSTIVARGNTVLFNIPGSCSFKNSTIATTGGVTCFVARGGDITIDNCIIATSLQQYTTKSSGNLWNLHMDDYSGTSTSNPKKWGTGGAVPYAAICIGNDADYTSDYQYSTNCTITNTEIHTGQGFMCVYVEGNSTKEKGATFTYSDCSFYYHTDESKTVIEDLDNGTAYTNTTPKEYDSSLYVSESNMLDYAIIYTNDSESYVTINGTGYKAAAD